MLFNDRTYSVLVVSASEKFNASLGSLLPNYYYHPVKYVSNIASAKRVTLENKYDMVIINTPLMDDFGTNFAVNLSTSKSTVCLMFVKSELEHDISVKVHDHGVYTLGKPTSAQAIKSALNYLTTTRERLRILETKTMSLEDKMEEIKLVNRAKWLLIDRLHMTEEDSHHYLEKQAMNRGVSRRQIAENIIATYK